MTSDIPEHRAELPPQPGHEVEAQINSGYERIRQLTGSVETFCGYALRQYHFSHPDNVATAEDSERTDTLITLHLALTAEHIRQAVTVLATDYGADLLNDRDALRNRADYVRTSDDLRARIGDYGGYREVDENEFGLILALRLTTLFGGSHRNYESALAATSRTLDEADEQTPESVLNQAASQELFYRSILGRDMREIRYETQRQLRELHRDDVTVFLEAFDQQRKLAKTDHAADQVLSSIDLELGLEMFPAGTDLRAAAEAVVTESRPGRRRYISLERLAVLERIREYYGAEHCQLVRGRRRGVARRTESGTLFGEEYIGLVIRHTNEAGETAEDLLAISPVALKDAGFLIRQDASEGIPWQDICRLSRSDAVRYFNARRLRFDRTTGTDTYDAYYRKVQALFGCSREQFGADHVLDRNRDGSYRLVRRARRTGQTEG